MKKILLLSIFIVIANMIYPETNNDNKRVNKSLTEKQLTGNEKKFIFTAINNSHIKTEYCGKIGPYKNNKVPKHITMNVYDFSNYYLIIETLKYARREYKIDKKSGKVYDINCFTTAVTPVDCIIK